MGQINCTAETGHRSNCSVNRGSFLCDSNISVRERIERLIEEYCFLRPQSKYKDKAFEELISEVGKALRAEEGH